MDHPEHPSSWDGSMFASLRLKDFIAITFYQHCVILVGPVVFIYGLPNWTPRIYTYQIPTFTRNPVDRHTSKTTMNILLLHITLSFRAFFSFPVPTTCLGVLMVRSLPLTILNPDMMIMSCAGWSSSEVTVSCLKLPL